VISCDTNILFPAFDRDSIHHARARTWLDDQASSQSFCLCEQVLMELYCLLRNPTVTDKPLGARDAVVLIMRLRSNPCWRIVDVVPGAGIIERVWKQAASKGFAYGRIFDSRLAATLKHHGVTEFATRSLSHFKRSGFERVWNPLADKS